MLVLTRKSGQKIRIGDDIVVTVVETCGSTVRLSIEAPRHIPIMRSELVDHESTGRETECVGAH
jgi:carbon storage regulator